MNSFGVFCFKVFAVLLILQVVGVVLLFLFDKAIQGWDWFRYSVRDVYWWVVHRTTKRFHVVHLRSLKPNYWDTDTRILHAVMDLIVEHVEINISATVLCRSEGELSFKEWLWMQTPAILRSNEWIRSRSRGLEHLAWEKKLDCLSIPLPERCPQQAQAARVIEEVYLWWVDIRPNRKSGEELVEWDKFIERRKLWGGDDGYFGTCRMPQALLDEERQALDKAIQIEQDYIDEDKKMIKKIVDILPHIWI